MLFHWRQRALLESIRITSVKELKSGDSGEPSHGHHLRQHWPFLLSYVVFLKYDVRQVYFIAILMRNNMNKLFSRTAFLLSAVLVIVLCLPAGAFAQSGSFFNERDNTYPLMGLKRSKTAYESAREEVERQRDLYAKGLISKTDLNRAETSFSDAEVNYQQSLLTVLFEAQYVSVLNATKYQAEGTRKRVRITVSNAASSSSEFKQFVEFEDELFRSLRPDIIHDVYVSLLNDEQAIVSLPYEAKIEELHYGNPITLEFILLQDADAVTVSIIYGSGSSRLLKVFLQKDASVNKALMRTEQFSQEVELGGTTEYPMSLELFSGESNTFKLAIVNFPKELNYRFTDSVTGNRLSQFQFTEGVNTREIGLNVFLPDRPTENVVMDVAILFYAVAIPRERIEEIGDLSNRTLTMAELNDLNIGYVALELVPRGIGEILVRAPQLFHTTKANETVVVSIDVVNEGTRRLDNVRVEMDPPLNWEERIEPAVVTSLEINEESRVNLYITPPLDVSPGRYEVRVRTSSLSDDLPIRGEDKTITIQIEQEANVVLTLIIILSIVGLVVGIVVFGIRLSRR